MAHKFVLRFCTRYNGLYLKDVNEENGSAVNKAADTIMDRLELPSLTYGWVGEDADGDWNQDEADYLSEEHQTTLINRIKDDSEFKKLFGDQEIEFEFDYISS